MSSKAPASHVLTSFSQRCRTSVLHLTLGPTVSSIREVPFSVLAAASRFYCASESFVVLKVPKVDWTSKAICLSRSSQSPPSPAAQLSTALRFAPHLPVGRSLNQDILSYFVSKPVRHQQRLLAYHRCAPRVFQKLSIVNKVAPQYFLAPPLPLEPVCQHSSSPGHIRN
jgi:hypothetical protein